MHPGGVRSAMDLFDFEKSANLKHPNVYIYNVGNEVTNQPSQTIEHNVSIWYI